MPQTTNNNQLDLLTIGDCSIDLFMQIPQNASGIYQEKNDHEHLPQMCFTHGGKIMVDSFSTSISGNSVNVGAGVTNLGLKTAIYTETGDDPNASRIITELKEIGVDTQYIHQNKNTDTALHAVIVFSGERTIFSYHGKRKYSVKEWNMPKFIYYTSIGEGFEDFQANLADYIKTNKVGLAFNPGTYQMAAGIEKLKNILAVTDILLVNKEEAQKLTGDKTTTTPETLHKNLANTGVKLSVITDGKNGATAYDGKDFNHEGAYIEDRPVVDMTGAGDAFSAGFMAAILYGKNLKEALRWGAINSSAQIRVIGSVAGMLNREQLENLL